MTHHTASKRNSGKRIRRSVLLSVIFIAAGLCAVWLADRTDREMRQDLLAQTHLIAESVNHDRIATLSGTSADLDNPAYLRLKSQFASLKHADQQIRFIYLVNRDLSGEIFFYVDNEPAGSEDESPPGDMFYEAPEALRHVFVSRKSATTGPVTDRRGTWVSAFVPLIDPRTGSIAAILGIDVDASNWKTRIAVRSIAPVALPAFALIAIFIVGFFLFDRRMKPEAGKSRWMKFAEPALIIAVGIVLTLFAAWLIQNESARNRADTIRNLAETRTKGLAVEFHTIRDIELESLARFYESSDYVSAAEFMNYAAYLTRNPAVQAWEWIPAVPAADRERFEQTAQLEGMQGFEIWQRDDAGNRVPAAGRQVYYPVFRVVPEEGNREAIGFDLGSEPVRRAALEEAMRTGLPTATDPITLVQETGIQKGMLIYRPVFADREKKRLLGFALAVLRLDDVLKATITAEEAVDTELILIRSHTPPEPLASTRTRETLPDKTLSIIRPVLAFGKTFHVATHAGPDYLRIYPARAGLSVLITGLMLTIALAFVVSTILRRRESLEYLVKERTAALSRSREQYQSLVDNIPGITYRCKPDTEWTMLFMSDAVDPLSGYPASDFIGNALRTYESVIHQDDRDDVSKSIHSALEEGRHWDIEYRIMHKAGDIRWVHERGRGIFGEDAGVAYLDGFILDITERKRAEAKLLASEEHLSTTLRSIGDGVIACDAAGAVVNLNATAEALTGWSSAEAAGQPIGEVFCIVNAKTRETAENPVFRAIREGVNVDLANHTALIAKDGTERQIADSCAPIRDASGKISGAVLVFRDVTEEYRRREELRISQERLLLATSGTGIGIWDWDIVNNDLFFDDSMLRMYGIERNDFTNIYEAWSSRLHPDDKKYAEGEIQAALNGEREYAPEFRIVLPDGSVRFISAASRTFRDDQGNPVRMLGINIDITERKRAEDELIKRTQELESIFRSAKTVSIIKTSLKGIVEEFSSGAEAIFGYDRNEMIGRHVGMLHAEEEAGRLTEYVDRLVQGQGITLETCLVRKSGDEFPAMFSVQPIFDALGQVISTLGISFDITERRAAEEALRKSKQQLEMFFSQSLHGFFMCMLDEPIAWNEDGADKDKLLEYALDHQRMTRVNQAMLDQYGATEEDFIGITISELFQHDLAHAEAIWRGLFDRGHWHVETSEQRMDGTPMIIDGDYICLYDDQGRIAGHFGVQMDITARKQAEEKLRDSEERHRVLFDQSQEAIVILAPPSWYFVAANPAALRLFGIESLAEMRNYKPWDFAPESQPDGFPSPESGQNLIDIVMRDGSHAFECIHQRKDGTNIYCEVFTNRVDLSGQSFVQATIRDITRRKQAESKLNEYALQMELKNLEIEGALLKAESATRAKSEFLANMSHEIRTPLNGVIGFTDLLIKTPLNDAQRQYAENANTAGHSLLGIINDILDFSKIEAGRLELDLIQTDIFELAEQVSDIVKYQSLQKGLELLLHIQPDMPRFATVDPVRLKQILINLLGNAIKFTENGEVTLSVGFMKTDDRRGRFNFQVRDTGIGISPEQQDKLFQAFSQADTSTTRRFGGTGLGLVIANLLAQKMGGAIDLSSEVGKGSIFSFDIEAEYEHGHPLDDESLTDIRRVMVVDDNENNRMILHDTFSHWGIACTGVDNGLSAIKLLRDAEPFDVIIMDYHMPYFDGIQTIRTIREELKLTPEQQPVILLHSSHEDELLNEQCLSLGVRFKLTKPVKAKQLLQYLKNLHAPLEKAAEEAEPEELLSVDGNPVILVAEDVPMNMLLVKTVIEQTIPTAEIIEAVNGQEAVEKAIQHTPDMILMDVQMPGMSGIEATLEIRTHEKEKGGRVPIIALTAGAIKEEEEKCFNAGMDGFLTKPLEQKSFKGILAKFLGKSAGVKAETAEKSDKAAAVFDPEDLLQRISGNRKLAAKLAEIFLTELPKQITELSHAIASGSPARSVDIAHKMKGSALNMAAKPFAELCHEIEKAGKAGDMEKITALLPKLKQQAEVVMGEIAGSW